MAQFPTGTCTGTVVWKFIGGAWFPVNPTPDDGDCTAATVFELRGVTLRVDADNGLPHDAFEAIQKAFPDAVKPGPNAGEFTLPMVPRGTTIVIP